MACADCLRCSGNDFLPPSAPAAALQRSGPKAKTCWPHRWKMTASTQLIDDFGGWGYTQSATSRKDLTSLLTSTQLHFFGNHWRFLDNRSADTIPNHKNQASRGSRRRAPDDLIDVVSPRQSLLRWRGQKQRRKTGRREPTQRHNQGPRAAKARSALEGLAISTLLPI